jgi:hypothetical protein
VAEKLAPMRMRPTAPMRTPAKTKTKRRRHAYAELAAAEPVLRNSPEALPIMASSPANKARNESQTNGARAIISKKTASISEQLEDVQSVRPV